MKDIFLCLGADGGARSEALLRAAALVSHRVCAGSVVCSSMFGDRHRQSFWGATVNMVVLLKDVPLEDEQVRTVLDEVEAQLGRVRDPDRNLPVLIDIDWVGTLRESVVEWNDRYDHGRSYVWQGLREIDHPRVRPELERISLERDFTAEQMAKSFYPLMTAEFATSLVSAALGEQPQWLAYKAA